MVGFLLAIAITSVASAPAILIPLLLASIGGIALLTRSDVDVVLCLTAVGAFLLPMNSVRLTSTLTVGDGFIALALVFAILIRADQHLLNVSGMKFLIIGISTVVFGGLVGVFFAPSFGGSLAALGRFAGATIALPILFGLWRPNRHHLQAIGWSVVLGSSVSAAVSPFGPRLLRRSQGLANHPNHLALASLLAVGVAVGLLLSTSQRRQRLMLLASVGILTMGIVLSGSRSGLVGEALILAVVALLTHSRALVLAGTTIVIVFVLVSASGLVGRGGTSAVARLLGGGGVTASDQARADSLRAALKEVSQHPLTGQGMQNATATHDILLEVAAAAGFFGLLGLIIIGWSATRPLWLRYRWGARRQFVPGDLQLIGTIASVVAFFANGLFAPQLYDRYIWMVITLSVALNFELEATAAAQPATGERRETA